MKIMFKLLFTVFKKPVWFQIPYCNKYSEVSPLVTLLACQKCTDNHRRQGHVKPPLHFSRRGRFRIQVKLNRKGK